MVVADQAALFVHLVEYPAIELIPVRVVDRFLHIHLLDMALFFDAFSRMLDVGLHPIISVAIARGLAVTRLNGSATASVGAVIQRGYEVEIHGFRPCDMYSSCEGAIRHEWMCGSPAYQPCCTISTQRTNWMSRVRVWPDSIVNSS